MPRATALIVAAGSGSRLGGGLPKQYRALGGKPMLRWAVEALVSHPRVDAVRVVIGEGQQALAADALNGLDVGDFIAGASERGHSVINGVKRLPSETGNVLVHDAARPFCPPDVVDRLLDALQERFAAVPVLPASDTLTRLSSDAMLGDRVDRDEVVRVQTPQAFRIDALIAAFQHWQERPPTDETAYFRARNIPVVAVAGDPMLDKLTTPADWDRAEAMLSQHLVARTGTGFDVHAFGGDGPVMLGGVAIPHPRGLAGHSDADVVLHAITDALLGAAGLGDIGEHFPPSDPRWRGVSSDRFLIRAAELVRSAGGIIDYVDCTLICEEPKVGPHRSAMKARVAAMLGLNEQDVSIKATTTDGLGFTGRREGIAAQAVANIRTRARP
ncbi:MAG: bifunctional 2-C-methyl-D-erythritol 4-phosphate cytidylyltransferase/2-C-methyl-D-erythritol 2,4-cyclodiphosphate synthase [Sphingomonas sp.]|nr:bifunctional 2-C-methyl-D-erythritol 4-phosphate cytidylyltransferase/2-C-methyl-D-erythritol 2,4-cyclodiphosphate synthase [Sphingomonas sp.]